MNMTDLERIESKLDKVLEILQRPKRTINKVKPVATEAFNKFWDLYPRKVNRSGALKIWCERELDARAGTVMAGLECNLAAWRKLRTEPQYIPHAATWLGQDRYTEPSLLPLRDEVLSDKDVFKLVRM